MKKTVQKYLGLVVLLLILAASSSSPVHADPYGPEGKHFGAGVIVGDPTGLSFKGFVTPSIAIDAIVAWSFLEDSLTLIGDLTYEFIEVPIPGPTFSLPFYLGVGAKIALDKGGKNDGETVVGVRVPVGLAMQFDRLPLELFIEVAPGIELTPESKFDVTGGVGARFYFF